MICALDVGTTKIVALIAEVDEDDNLRVIGAGRAPAHGLRRGVVINTEEATAAIGQAITQAEGIGRPGDAAGLRGHRRQPHQRRRAARAR